MFYSNDHTPIHIYVIKDEQGKEILLPAIKEVLKQVDLENKKIIVHIIKGLI